MLSEIDRTKTFVLIKSTTSFLDHVFHASNFSLFLTRATRRQSFFISNRGTKKYFLHVEIYRAKTCVSAVVIDKRKRELNFRFLITKGFSFRWRISGFGKNCVKAFRKRWNSNTFSCNFPEIHEKKRNKAIMIDVTKFSNFKIIFSETLQLDSN